MGVYLFRFSILVLLLCSSGGVSFSQNAVNPYPKNFSSKDFKHAKKNPSLFEGKVIAFEGVILEVKPTEENRPYLKVKTVKGPIVWVSSLVNSQYDKVGHAIRFIGYFKAVAKDKLEGNVDGFHVIVFGEIDLSASKLAFYPDKEKEVKQWGKGVIPEME